MDGTLKVVLPELDFAPICLNGYEGLPNERGIFQHHGQRVIFEQSRPPDVIPAKAGIHGYDERFPMGKVKLRASMTYSGAEHPVKIQWVVQEFLKQTQKFVQQTEKLLKQTQEFVG